MGKIFIGNPYNVDSEYEDQELTFIVEEGGPVDLESSIDSVDAIETTDSETTDDEDFFYESSNDSDWIHDPFFDSDTDHHDQEEDDVYSVNFCYTEILPETISTLKPSDVESISNDGNPPTQEPPTD
ncbi:hypothetical protein WA026_005015 [Henosepilachna vigintioctopunctata]|uniref:Uncharacterized protein n=1 Tax=Henosepilachna vigintioctopunctata TaxID=420089 RepID=A0AAW1UUC1_9CUCU